MATAVLTWAPNTEADLAGYKVYRGFDGTPPTTLLATLGKVVTFTDPLPNIFTSVTYNLTAFDSSGNESAHSVNVTKAYDANPPAAPTGLSVVIN